MQCTDCNAMDALQWIQCNEGSAWMQYNGRNAMDAMQLMQCNGCNAMQSTCTGGNAMDSMQ